MSSRENYHLPIVRAHIAAQLGRPLARVAPRPSGGPTHDLATDDGLLPSIAIEVKELVPGEFLATQAQVARDHGLDSRVLSKRWCVVVEEDPLSERLPPVPRFPDDPADAEVSELASLGFRVVPRAERVAEWEQQHDLAPRDQLQVRGLASAIERSLATLERLGIAQTRTYTLPAAPDDQRAAREALRAIAARTRDALCMAHDPVGSEVPGIDLAFSYGSVRTGDANVVASRVQTWLDSTSSRNLLESLRLSEADERHAALWLGTDAEAASAQQQGASFCPTIQVGLPADVDVLWCFVGPVALRYNGSWSAAAAKPAE